MVENKKQNTKQTDKSQRINIDLVNTEQSNWSQMLNLMKTGTDALAREFGSSFKISVKI